MPGTKSRAHNTAAVRARRRAEGLSSIEAVLHQDDIATLDRLKARFGFASRSEVLRVLIAKTDLDTLTSAEAPALNRSAA